MASRSREAMGILDPPAITRDQWDRDWQWLAHQAPLIGKFPLPDSITEAWKNPLRKLGPVEDFFSPETGPRTASRVGYYNEALVHSALLGVPGITDLQHSLPVREGTRTLGELDFLFRYEDQLCHLEIALKFYLYSAKETCLESHYIGPNAGDTLERKSAKLLGHQLLLGKKAFPEVAESYLFCPGILFYHPQEIAPEITPAFLSPGHGHGIWLRASEFAEWANRKNSCEVGEILRKPFWLSARPTRPIDEVVSAVESHFAESRYPVALAISSLEERNDPKRLFVVADDWPRSP